MSLNIETQFWGLKNYSDIELLQHKILRAFQSNHLVDCRKIFLLYGEFKNVMTCGLRVCKDNDELNLPMQLQKKDYTLAQTSRGGLVTLHNPGQLVIYPIFSLREYDLGIKAYVEILLRTTARTLKKYGIDSFVEIGANAGVYTEFGKIAFCGLKVSQGLTSHGVSINLTNEISDFKYILACGHKNQQMTSFKKYTEKKLSTGDNPVLLADFFNDWVIFFEKEILERKNSSEIYCCRI